MIKTTEQAKQFVEGIKKGWKVCKVRNGDGWFNIYLNGRLYQTEDGQGLIKFAREEMKFVNDANKKFGY
jgi:hypothetical protein